VVSGGGESAPLVESEGARVFTLPIRTKSELNPKIYKVLPQLLRLIKEEQVDILHAHSRVTQVMAFWASAFCKIPFVTTCHGFYKIRFGRKILPAWGKRVIAISEGVAEHLHKDFHLPRNQVAMIYNGVDLEKLKYELSHIERLEARSKFGFKPQDIILGNIARLVEEKGQEYLIRAVPELLKKNPSVKALIVGDGRTRSMLENLAAELGVKEQIHFTGYLPNVTEALAVMDMFVFPATWREGFGLSLVEAMGAGKPIVVSNTCVLSSLIEQENAGLLVPPHDSSAIAEAVQVLLKNVTQRQTIAANALRLAEDQFSLQNMGLKMGGLYREILLQSRG